MKTAKYILILLLLASLSCREKVTNECPVNPEYTVSNGIIFGYDMRKCMCCGGWLVDINKDTLRIFNSFPAMDSVMAKVDLPVSVSIGWKRLKDGCGQTFQDLIEINYFKLK